VWVTREVTSAPDVVSQLLYHEDELVALTHDAFLSAADNAHEMARVFEWAASAEEVHAPPYLRTY
jgi:hypothetical protein